MTALRRFKRRETLRISYGDIIRGQRLETVTRQISYLADAIVEAAVARGPAQLEAKRGVPRGPDGERARFVVLAMGKLGGVELNYSSDIDLIFLYDVDGTTDGPRPLAQQRVFRPPGPRRGAPAHRADRTGHLPTASICGCGPKGSAARS